MQKQIIKLYITGAALLALVSSCEGDSKFSGGDGNTLANKIQTEEGNAIGPDVPNQAGESDNAGEKKPLPAKKITTKLSSIFQGVVEAGPIPIVASFERDIAGFNSAKIKIAGAVVGGILPDAGKVRFTIYPTRDGKISVFLEEKAAITKDGATSLASNTIELTVDSGQAPLVSLVSDINGLTNKEIYTVDIKFTDAMAGFDQQDLVKQNLNILSFSGKGDSYQVKVSPINQGLASLQVPDKAATADGVGNIASNPLTWDFDSISPVISLTSAVPDPTAEENIGILLETNEPLLNTFKAGDSTVVNSTITNITKTLDNFNFTLKADTNLGNVKVSIAAGALQDLAGNPANAVELSRYVDRIRPTITLVPTSPTTGNQNPYSLDIDLSEPLKRDITGADLTLVGVAVTTLTKKSNATSYSLVLTPLAEGNGSVAIEDNKLKDLVGNGNLASNTVNFSYLRERITKEESATSQGDLYTIYTVNTAGQIQKIELDKQNSYPAQTFSVDTGGGHRTFVSDLGLFIGSNSGKIHLLPKNAPQGSNATMIQQIPGADSNSRTCVTSFTFDGKDYLGALYQSNSRLSFVRYPLDPQQPNGVDTRSPFTSQSTFVGTYWGYSCYMDQQRNMFWGQSCCGQSPAGGVNVKTGVFTGFENAENQQRGAADKFVNDPAINSDLLSSKSKSYAMSGDSDKGYLLTGRDGQDQNFYTAAHEKTTDTLFFTTSGASTLTTVNYSCFDKPSTCQPYHIKTWNLASQNVPVLGPLSSLNNGSVIGASRSAKGSLYQIKPVQAANGEVTGVDLTLIKENLGDLYMYTDFTGATAFAKTFNIVLELDTADNNLNHVNPKITWQESSGMPGAKFFGFNPKIRCYMQGNNPPAFSGITLNVSEQATPITASSCNNKKYNRVEIYLESAGTSGFSRTKSFTFRSEQ